MIPLLSSAAKDYNNDNIEILSHCTVRREDNVVTLLPTDNHTVAYPLSFNSKEKKTLSGKVTFHTIELFENGNAIEIDKEKFHIELQPKHKKCLIVNLLDRCYGHSLLKLFNLQEVYTQYHEQYDLIVLVNPSVKYLIPEDKFCVCTINVKYTEIVNLSPILSVIRASYNDVDQAILNTQFAVEDKLEICKFFNLPITPDSEKDTITFYYRTLASRRWGNRQHNKITKYFSILKPYFNNVKFCVIGEKDAGTFPSWIEDKRCEKYNSDIDKEYNSIISRSIITAGVHGSSLIIPSILSKQIYHLIPSHKKHNADEDILNAKSAEISGWYSNINLFGKNQLNCFSGKKLGTDTIVLFQSQLEKEYKYHCTQMINNNRQKSQYDYISENYSIFNYQSAKDLKDSLETFTLRKMRIRKILGV